MRGDKATAKAMSAAMKYALFFGLMVPVGPADTLARLGEEADVVVCPLRPRTFMAVGQWYRDFHQTGDEEVSEILGLAWGA